MIIYMKKSYKKRSRKRSTKKRARRRTRRAGEYSKLAKGILKKEFDANKYKASLGDENEADYLQKRADRETVYVATQGRGIFGSDGMPVTPSKPSKLKKRARKAYKRLSSKIPPQKPRRPVGRHKPLNAQERLAEQIILTEPDKKRRKITLGNRGGKRKRKTRRRRRRRR